MYYLCSVDERDESTKLNLNPHNTTTMGAMKLGTETNSLINAIHSTSQTKPEVGKGATILKWSDREPYQVLEVSKEGKQVKMARINAKLIKGSCATEDQEYDYSEVTDDVITVVYRYKNWYETYFSPVMGKTIYNKLNIRFGMLDKYSDPTF